MRPFIAYFVKLECEISSLILLPQLKIGLAKCYIYRRMYMRVMGKRLKIYLFISLPIHKFHTQLVWQIIWTKYLSSSYSWH